MTVAAMRAENDVLGFQISTNPDGDCLLADVSMTGTVNQAALMRSGQLLFRAANEQHLPIEGQKLRLIQTGKFTDLHGKQFTIPAVVRHAFQSLTLISCLATILT